MIFWFGIVLLGLTTGMGVYLFRGSRSIHRLSDYSPWPSDEKAVSVSVVVAARNEERNIREALTSLVHLDYPWYELIVVNDRSDDGTESIITAMQDEFPFLHVVTVQTLPEGWLGKNHALWQGSLIASGDFLLFTDADVVMARDTLSRAVGCCVETKADHLVATPALRLPSPVLGMFSIVFTIVFSLYMRPWQARNPHSRAHVGVGAFNLVRTAAYRDVGGHQALAMRPDDDVKLGKLMKSRGYHQEVVYGSDFLEVEWYASTPELLRGLEKNAFAGAEYSIALVVSGVAMHLITNVWPFLAVVLLPGMAKVPYCFVVLVLLWMAYDSARFHRIPRWYSLGYPLASLLFSFIMLRTMILNLLQGGIWWRGTFYSLTALRKARL